MGRSGGNRQRPWADPSVSGWGTAGVHLEAAIGSQEALVETHVQGLPLLLMQPLGSDLPGGPSSCTHCITLGLRFALGVQIEHSPCQSAQIPQSKSSPK